MMATKAKGTRTQWWQRPGAGEKLADQLTLVSEAEVEAAARAMKRSGDDDHEYLKGLARDALTAAARVRKEGLMPIYAAVEAEG